jgi:hypothetical protein
LSLKEKSTHKILSNNKIKGKKSGLSGDSYKVPVKNIIKEPECRGYIPACGNNAFALTIVKQEVLKLKTE